MNPMKCASCGLVIDERTGERLHPEQVTAWSGFTCDSCRERINRESLEKWRLLRDAEKRIGI